MRSAHGDTRDLDTAGDGWAERAEEQQSEMGHTPGPWNIFATQPQYSGPCYELCNAYNDLDDEQREDRDTLNARDRANKALILQAPQMAGLLETILARLDLEAAERGEGAVFPCNALRDDIRAMLARVRGEEVPRQYPATAKGELQRQAAYSAERQRREDRWNRCGDPDEVTS